jgi:hypothetical protein
MKIAVMIAVVALLALGCMLEPILAHDHERPELDGWYHGLHSKAQTWCCEGDEATHLADEDWESKNGHYRVRIDGEWVEVPDGAVIDAPNRDGRTLVWPFYLDGQRKGVRCFMPGSMT